MALTLPGSTCFIPIVATHVLKKICTVKCLSSKWHPPAGTCDVMYVPFTYTWLFLGVFLFVCFLSVFKKQEAGTPRVELKLKKTLKSIQCPPDKQIQTKVLSNTDNISCNIRPKPTECRVFLPFCSFGFLLVFFVYSKLQSLRFFNIDISP